MKSKQYYVSIIAVLMCIVLIPVSGCVKKKDNDEKRFVDIKLAPESSEETVPQEKVNPFNPDDLYNLAVKFEKEKKLLRAELNYQRAVLVDWGNFKYFEDYKNFMKNNPSTAEATNLEREIIRAFAAKNKEKFAEKMMELYNVNKQVTYFQQWVISHTYRKIETIPFIQPFLENTVESSPESGMYLGFGYIYLGQHKKKLKKPEKQWKEDFDAAVLHLRNANNALDPVKEKYKKIQVLWNLYVAERELSNNENAKAQLQSLIDTFPDSTQVSRWQKLIDQLEKKNSSQ